MGKGAYFMVEFGRKVKQIREEKGMTQQTMAEKLYVTRQAVSRWECGARQPDLLTAKKIAKLLDVSLDELLSGEELQGNIERKPVLAQPAENALQTALYAGAAIIYLLLCMFSMYDSFRPDKALAGTPMGRTTLITVSADLTRIANFAAAFTGFVLSVKNRLTAKMTGAVMCVPYLFAAVSFLATYIEMQMNNNGYMSALGWFTDFCLPLGFAVCILLFFGQRAQGMPLAVIEGICVFTIGGLAYAYKLRFRNFTDLGFVVTTVHMAGKAGMSVLLGYQAYVWSRKKRAAYRERGI